MARRRLKTAGSRVPPGKTRFESVSKTTDDLYSTSDFRIWRKRVCERAGWRCEEIEDGIRCERRSPEYRVYADHIVEVKDGGSAFDISNGQCLCAHHHTQKTNTERARRLGIQ